MKRYKILQVQLLIKRNNQTISDLFYILPKGIVIIILKTSEKSFTFILLN